MSAILASTCWRSSSRTRRSWSTASWASSARPASRSWPCSTRWSAQRRGRRLDDPGVARAGRRRAPAPRLVERRWAPPSPTCALAVGDFAAMIALMGQSIADLETDAAAGRAIRRAWPRTWPSCAGSTPATSSSWARGPTTIRARPTAAMRPRSRSSAPDDSLGVLRDPARAVLRRGNEPAVLSPQMRRELDRRPRRWWWPSRTCVARPPARLHGLRRRAPLRRRRQAERRDPLRRPVHRRRPTTSRRATCRCSGARSTR